MEFGTNDELNFCIMTSANYLTKALVMYDSLEKVCNNIKFFYFTFDDTTFEYLNQLDNKNIIPISLTDLEMFYPELLNTKSNRNNSEYFFTCTPHIIDYTLQNYKVTHVTYLDADLYFYQNPMVILNELRGNSVLITEHRYFPIENNPENGKYCVQFIPVKNDDDGKKVIKWWSDKCVEWCYVRAEDGKYADQGYLNDWPVIFDKIVVMENRGAGVAPWNLGAYIFENMNEKKIAFNEEISENVDVIFYHFQGLKIYANKLITLGITKKKKNVHHYIYKDYIKKLGEKENELIKILKISRQEFNYQMYPHSNFKLLLSTIRRIVFPKKNELIFYYKYLNNYKWLH